MKGSATEAALLRLGDTGETHTDLGISIYLPAYSEGSFRAPGRCRVMGSN